MARLSVVALLAPAVVGMGDDCLGADGQYLVANGYTSLFSSALQQAYDGDFGWNPFFCCNNASNNNADVPVVIAGRVGPIFEENSACEPDTFDISAAAINPWGYWRVVRQHPVTFDSRQDTFCGRQDDYFNIFCMPPSAPAPSPAAPPMAPPSPPPYLPDSLSNDDDDGLSDDGVDDDGRTNSDDDDDDKRSSTTTTITFTRISFAEAGADGRSHEGASLLDLAPNNTWHSPMVLGIVAGAGFASALAVAAVVYTYQQRKAADGPWNELDEAEAQPKVRHLTVP